MYSSPMDRQAFTVLPPLSPRLPQPPATPASTRVAPRSVAHRDKNAFVILAELGDAPLGTPAKAAAPAGGRSSPFRGRGFRAPSPQNSRIPIPASNGKSAPASPAKKKKATTSTSVSGKSAPASPARKTTVAGQTLTRNNNSKRTESSSKLVTGGANSKASGSQDSLPRKPTGSSRPPLPKGSRSTNTKGAQLTKRNEQTTKPTPAVRTRLNNKPISTDLGNNRFVKNTLADNDAAKTTDNKNETSDNAKSSSLPSSTDVISRAKETLKEIEQTRIETETEAARRSDVDPMKTELNKHVSLVPSNPDTDHKEIHKISIEINSSESSESRVKNDSNVSVAVSNLTGQNSRATGESKLQKAVKSHILENNSNDRNKSVKKLITDGDIKQLIRENRKANTTIEKQMRNGADAVVKTEDILELENLEETVIQIDDENLLKASDALTSKLEEITKEVIPDKDATLVEWTTKQPLELAQPQPDVIPTDPTVLSIEETTEETVQGPAEVEVEAGNHTVTFRSPEIHPVSPRGRSYGPAFLEAFRERVFGCCSKDKNKNIKVKPAAVNKQQSTANNQQQKNDSTTNTGGKQSFYSRFCCKWRRHKDPPPPRLIEGAAAANNNSSSRKWDVLDKLNCCKKCRRKPGAINPEPPPRRYNNQDGRWWNRVWRKMFCLDMACCAKCKRKKPLGPAGSIKKKEKPKVTNEGGLPKLEPSLVEHTSVMKASIPVLPICLAWFCLILNIFLPGTGTITSGFLCLCFGKPRFSVNDNALARLGAFCVDFIVGVSQIFTIIFCLVGWGWSIWWGVMMVRLSRKNRRIKLAEKGAPAPVVNQNHDLEAGGPR